MYTGRNYERRRALTQQIKRIEAERAAAIESLYEQDEAEQWDDERWLREHAAFCERYSTEALILERFALEYPETRNSWFADFVKSFGLCESRRITGRQAEVLRKYSEPAHEARNIHGIEYYVRVGNLLAKTTFYGEGKHGYLTVKAYTRRI